MVGSRGLRQTATAAEEGRLYQPPANAAEVLSRVNVAGC